MRRFLALCSLLLLFNVNPIFSASLKKAMQNLNSGDFIYALEHLSKAYIKDSNNIVALYGLSVIYSSEDFEYNNLILANNYIKRCMLKLPLDSTFKNFKKISKVGIRDQLIVERHFLINSWAFNYAEEINTLNSYNHYINNYNFRSLVKKAKSKRDNIAFHIANEAYNVDSFRLFIEKYPEARQVDQAKDIYELLLFKDITRDSTVEAFRRYMDLFPNGPYYHTAREKYDNLLFGNSIKKGDIESFEIFLNKYPNNANVPLAEDSIYMIATRMGLPMDIYSFIQTYPGNRNVERAWEKLYRLVTVNDNPEEYEEFIEQFSEYPYMFEAEEALKDSRVEYEVFEQNGKFGYRELEKRDTLISAKFTEASPFFGGLAAVSMEDCSKKCKYGYINKNSTWIVRQIYDYAGDFKDGYAIVGRGNCETDNCRYGMINKKGDTVIPLIYDELYHISNDLALAGDDIFGYGYINPKGKIVLALQYEDANEFSEEKAAVLIDSCWRYIDKKGQILIDKCFKKAGSFNENYAPASVDGQNWGYVNKFGEWAIDPQFYFAGQFIQGRAKVIIKKKHSRSDMETLEEFYIDKDGKSISKK